jgi:tetratricopeptide (TPR) repeat protein
LARRAIAAQPDNASGYFWLASLLAAEAPDEAIALYRQGVSLAPEDGRGWLALADLLRAAGDDALDAYLQACLHGDPGANGCLRAGSLAEERGDVAAAIEYYRLSNWDTARSKAAELEQRLAGD